MGRCNNVLYIRAVPEEAENKAMEAEEGFRRFVLFVAMQAIVSLALSVIPFKNGKKSFSF